MAVRICCIESCKSRSDREEDRGVGYLKFPKDASMRDNWIQVTRRSYADIESTAYVCSRHFLKRDFEVYQGYKYVLLSGAAPSIFPWTIDSLYRTMDEFDLLTERSDENEKNVSSSSKESEPENLDAIRKFIQSHSKGDNALDSTQSELTDNSITEMEVSNTSGIESHKDETVAIATSVMNYVINESASEYDVDNAESTTKSSLSPKTSAENKGFASVSLSVGSKVEAKDFADNWYSAEILEVDYDEMEILVRYDSTSKKPEEWINVNSPRLRPITISIKPTVAVEKPKIVKPIEVKSSVTKPPAEAMPPVKEEKLENKQKALFAVGERCLARWRDNRRFTATVHNDLGNGNYEIIFDDGFFWKCSVSRLSKWKDSSTPSSSSGTGPSTSSGPNLPFHTHLFDPTRDYLGSKSERREKKRKLNIKEIFNIGQKQKKKETPIKEQKPKVEKTKTPKSKAKVGDVKLEKKDIPDAIASIIGTVTNKEDKPSSSKPVQESKKEIKIDLTETKKGIEAKSGKNSHVEKNTAIVSAKVDLDNKGKGKELDDKEKELDDQDSSMVDIEGKNKERKDLDMSLSDEDTESAKFSDGDNEPLDDPDAITFGDQDEKLDPIQKEETKLQNFEKPDEKKHNEQVVRIKEVINKLQDGLDKELKAASPKVEIEKEAPMEVEAVKPAEPVEPIASIAVKEEIKEEIITEEKEVAKEDKQETESKDPLVPIVKIIHMKPKKKMKFKKKPHWPKQERPVKKRKVVDSLNSKLEKMQMQIDEMQMQIKKKDQELQQLVSSKEVLEPSGVSQEPKEPQKPLEWCCKWHNGEPVGIVVASEPDNAVHFTNIDALPRRAIEVQDTRLPEGWKKVMVRRSLGHSAGKWDVVIVSPENRRFHTKNDIRNYIELVNPSMKAYEHVLSDFGIHLKEARRMGWVTEDSRYTRRRHLEGSMSLKRKKYKLKDKERKVKRRKLNPKDRYKVDRSLPGPSHEDRDSYMDTSEERLDNSTLEDGFVYVGSLKVQVIENLLRCPAEGCFKNFRNNTLLQMHIKHYHRDLRKMLGKTPKVLDLAYRRTLPTKVEAKPRHEPDNKIFKVKFSRPPKRVIHSEMSVELDTKNSISVPGPSKYPEKIPRSLDSPMMRQLQLNRPIKRPKVLLPVRRPEPVETPDLVPIEDLPDLGFDNSQLEPSMSIPPLEVLDFETAISTHTVTRPVDDGRQKYDRKVYATTSKAPISEDEEVLSMNSDVETRSSFPRSGTPDSKTHEVKTTVPVESVKPESKEEPPTYIYTETGECIKLERMKREEIINCHCGFREEDGLMVQCELCLCWQHAHCYNIQRESDVPKKYTCYICLNPRRGRRSQRFLQDQDRMTEGLLPGGKPSERLRKTHEISGSLLKLMDALHALRLKYHVASKKNHPKLYLWATDWDAGARDTQEEDKNMAAIDIGKENMPLKSDEESVKIDIGTEDIDDQLSQKEGSLSGHSLLGGLLTSPGGPSLDMPISTTELEKLANSVAEPEQPTIVAPQPEAAIDNAECLQKLMQHMQRCKTLLDAKLDKLEADIVELEAQDPMFEDDESPDYFPRTKQTIQMLMRDLSTMEMLGVIT